MAAATVTERIETNDPTKEIVILTADDTNTYTSRKFGKVRAVQVTYMEDTGALSIPLSCDISGAIVTLNATGLAAKKICLTLYGVR